MLPRTKKTRPESLTEPGFRWAFVVLFLLAMVLQAFAPVRGMAAQGGDVIEICGASGVSELRIDVANGETGPHDPACGDCAACVLCCGQAAAALPPVQEVLVLHGELRERADRLETPLSGRIGAASWADNRAPPVRDRQAEKLIVNLFMGPPRSEGRAPWI